MKPVVRFRLYPEAPRGLYLLVAVHPSLRALHAHAKRNGDKQIGEHGAHGYCACYLTIGYRNGRARTHPLFAEVHLYRQRLTMELVTHEMLHATIQWGRRIGFDFARLDAVDSVNDDEERLTYAHGRLCREFVHRATLAGLYE